MGNTMKLKFGENEVKMVFLREQDLVLLKMYKLQPSDLPKLPTYSDVSDEDCLSWLKFQRAMEKKYAGFKSTTYSPTGDNKNQDILRSSTLFKAKYEEVLKSDDKPKIGNYLYGSKFNGMMFILVSNKNTVENTGFRYLPGNLPSAVYRCALDTVSSFGFYFKSTPQLNKFPEDRDFITPGFILSKVVA